MSRLMTSWCPPLKYTAASLLTIANSSVARAWCIVEKDKAPIVWLKERSEKHKKKKLLELDNKEKHHKEAAQYEGRRGYVEHNGEYFYGQTKEQQPT